MQPPSRFHGVSRPVGPCLPRIAARAVGGSRAFTFPELLVVLGVVCVLAALQVARATPVRTRSAQAVCLDNLRRLTGAWLLFAHDRGGTVCGNLDGTQGAKSTNSSWCAGWLDLTSNQANTNTTYLRDAQLGGYLNGDTTVFKCPADRSSVRIGGRIWPRVRSVSMNGYLGEKASPYTQGYYQFRKVSELVTLAPRETFVFLDEREEGINDNAFLVDMSGFDPRSSSALTIVDFPASYHEGGAGFSFADGHAETWHWKDWRTMPILKAGEVLDLVQRSPNNQDVDRMQSHTSRRISNPTR
jgi:prepilin-type N-terminal cleavage/methylation domain-containing protein/prepilin-type processing-associated H-X9-DG protein